MNCTFGGLQVIRELSKTNATANRVGPIRGELSLARSIRREKTEGGKEAELIRKSHHHTIQRGTMVAV